MGRREEFIETYQSALVALDALAKLLVVLEEYDDDLPHGHRVNKARADAAAKLADFDRRPYLGLAP